MLEIFIINTSSEDEYLKLERGNIFSWQTPTIPPNFQWHHFKKANLRKVNQSSYFSTPRFPAHSVFFACTKCKFCILISSDSSAQTFVWHTWWMLQKLWGAVDMLMFVELVVCSMFIGLAYMGDVIARTKCGEGEGRSGNPHFYRQPKTARGVSC